MPTAWPVAAALHPSCRLLPALGFCSHSGWPKRPPDSTQPGYRRLPTFPGLAWRGWEGRKGAELWSQTYLGLNVLFGYKWPQAR